MRKLNAVVSGAHRGKKYAQQVSFSMIPPKGKNYYGNGYTMNVEMDDYTTPTIHYIDVSRSGTIDIEKLARVWIKDYFGNTVKDIRFLEQREVLRSAER